METFQTARFLLDTLINQSRIPGVQYVVVNSNDTLLEFHSGWANLKDRFPIQATTTMMAYSMSKTFTAAAVLQLANAKKISLDAPVDQFLDFCTYGPGVTLRRLLAHTSGVPNPIPLRWVHTPDEHDTFDERKGLIEVLGKHSKLAFTAGTRYAYSNIGYWLLGYFIERISGLTLGKYVEAHIFQALGVSPQALAYTIPNIAQHACGYLEKYSLTNAFKRLLIDQKFIGSYCGPWLEIYPHYLNGAAFGGLVGNAQAISKFLQDQLRPHSVLLTDETRQEFYRQQQTNIGQAVQSSLGWNIGVLGGKTCYFKEGGGAGFRSMMRLYPAAGIGTILMTNATGFKVGRWLDRLDATILNASE